MTWDSLPEKYESKIQQELTSKQKIKPDTKTDPKIDPFKEKYNKYKNKKIEYNGIIFDSQKECNRYQELSYLEKSHEIKDLQLQVKYVLIPTQREIIKDKNGNLITGRVIERECSYIADFVYKNKNGEIVVEDTKGMRTEVYKIKKKLMLMVHKIRITEI